MPLNSRFADYLERVIYEATTPNGVLGVKVHWYQFEHLTRRVRALRALNRLPDRSLLAAIFPNLHYIHLMRRDTIRQAVSFVRATDTQLWSERENSIGLDRRVLARTPYFSVEKLDRMLEIMVEFHRNWRRYFEQIGVSPLELFYEDLALDYETSTRRILEFLHVPAPAGRLIRLPRLRKQSDDLSETWVTRYRRILAERNHRPTSPD